MTITQSLISIYLFFSIILAVFSATYALSKGNTYLVRTFSSLCIFLGIYLFGYLLEINSYSLAQMIFWNQIQYIGIPFYPAFGLILALVYTKTLTPINKWVVYTIFTIPLLTFIIRLTNSYHNFYYTFFQLKTTSGFSFLALGKGTWYLIYCGYLTLTFILTTFCYIRNYSKNVSNHTASYKIMILSSLIPFLGLTLILINPGNLGIDYVALFLPTSLLLLLLSLFKYDFLELKTLAREVLFEQSTDAMILIDNSNSLMDYNSAAKTLFNNLVPSKKGLSIEEVLKEETTFLEALKTENKKDLKLYNENGYGYFESKIVSIKDKHGNKAGKLITLINITERKQDHEKLNILATTDPLTGLYNRRKFFKLAKFEMKCSEASGTPLSVLLIDLDHFKKINDSMGHAAGDSVLKHLGIELKNFFSKTDIIGRLGGEEFAVLLPNTNLNDAEKIVEKFRNKLRNSPALYEDNFISFTFSCGVSTYNKNFKNFDEIFKLADEGLYQSKANGRNKTTIKSIL